MASIDMTHPSYRTKAQLKLHQSLCCLSSNDRLSSASLYPTKLNIALLPAETRFRLACLAPHYDTDKMFILPSQLHGEREFVLGEYIFSMTGNANHPCKLAVRTAVGSHHMLECGLDYDVAIWASNNDLNGNWKTKSAVTKLLAKENTNQQYHLVDQSSIRFPSSIANRKVASFLGLPDGTTMSNGHGHEFRVRHRAVERVDTATNLVHGYLCIEPLDDASAGYIDLNCPAIYNRCAEFPLGLYKMADNLMLRAGMSPHNIKFDTITLPQIDRLPFFCEGTADSIELESMTPTSLRKTGFQLLSNEDMSDFEKLFS